MKLELKWWQEEIWWPVRRFFLSYEHWPHHTKNFFKHRWQKLTKGYSDDETWNLEYNFAKWIYPRLLRFKELNNGFPSGIEIDNPKEAEIFGKCLGNSKKPIEKYDEFKIWTEIIDKMLKGFKYEYEGKDSGDFLYWIDKRTGHEINPKWHFEKCNDGSGNSRLVYNDEEFIELKRDRANIVQSEIDEAYSLFAKWHGSLWW